MRIFPAAFAAIATFVVATPTQAATYTVDNTMSSLTLSAINAGGFDFGPQFVPGDLTATYSGTFDATVSGGGANPTITFTGGDVDADANPNAAPDYLPTEGGFVPSEASSALDGGDFVFADGSFDPSGAGDGVFTVGEDNYGVSGTGFVAGIKYAVRNFAITFTGGGIANDAIADAQAMSVIDGWYALDLAGAGVAFGTEETVETWAAQALGATAAGDIGYSLVGTTETITIPYVQTFVASGMFATTISGQIVGTRTVVVPEPAIATLLGLCAVGLAVQRRRLT